MTRPDPEVAARALCADRFPTAVQAWLGGSVAQGLGTATSDLDITVLTTGPGVYRESLMYEGWPVELFVHTAASVRHFVEKDVVRRRPTMARLVAEGIPLLAGDGGEEVSTYCKDVLAAGPVRLSPDALDHARYTLTDLLDDLVGGGSTQVMAAVAVEIWKRVADLILGLNRRWTGCGKWLVRELSRFDQEAGTAWVDRLDSALRQAVSGDVRSLRQVAEDVLDLAGGQLWSGFRQAAPPREQVGLDLVTLVVREYDEAVAFFTEVLGFVVAEDAPARTNDGRAKRWLVVRPPGGGTGVLLARADGEEQEARVGDQTGGRVSFFLRVADFEAAHARLVSAGVTLMGDVRDEAYGTLQVFADPFGNKWDLLGPADRQLGGVEGRGWRSR